MTAVAQMQKQKHCGLWSEVFPQEQFSATQSVLFIKKLLAVSISNITYLRAIFPESAFGDRALEDLHLKILRDDSKCPGASQVIKWVRGCFDALEKNYLRQIILGIYVDPTKEDTLIESYTFRFSYENQGSLTLFRNEEHIASAKSSTETKKATVSLLRTLMLLMQSLHPLPDDVLMTMKLLYYDKVTPTDYEPEGFKPTKLDYFFYEMQTTNLTIGKVETPFHQMRLNVKTDAKQFNMIQDPLAEQKEAPFSPQKTKKDGQELADVIPETQICEGLGILPESHNDSFSGKEKCMNSPLEFQKMDTSKLDTESQSKHAVTKEKPAKRKPAEKTKSKKLTLSKSKSLYSSKPELVELEMDLDETEILSQKTNKLSVASKGGSKKIDLKIQNGAFDSLQRERGIKRVTPVGNQAYEFELEMLSESQEIPSQEVLRRSKRKKVSMADKPLLV